MPSTCRDFEILCQAALDRRSNGAPGLGPVLADHAAACPACLPVYNRYLALRRAIDALPAPGVPDGFADRALGALADRPTATIPYRTIARVAVGLAASALIAGLVAYRKPGAIAPEAPVIASKGGAPRSLALALSDATSETLDLAREASAPAARVGRQVIRSASIPELSIDLALSDEPASAVLQTVGDEVGAGVRPISGSARSAFGFLIPGGSRPRTPAAPSPAKSPKGT